jgi:predicted MPP superfamily phosphohydrolase/branched-subunit amino acid transport protein AzlD
MLIRLLIVISVLFLLNGYIALHILHNWPFAEQHSVVIWGITALFIALQMMPFIGRLPFVKSKEKPKSKIISFIGNWLPYLAFGVFSCLFIYSLIADVIGLGWQLVFVPTDPERFNVHMLAILAIVTIGTIILGIRQAISGPKAVKIDITLDNLPASFDGFKIVQISDTHIGSTIGTRYIEKIIAIVNALKPDLIALTGDIIEGSVKDLKNDVRLLSNLQAPYGRYYITGNHEYYWDAAGWIKEFKNNGFNVLLNEHAIIKINNEELTLAGVTDYSTINMQNDHASDPVKALEGSPANNTKILLAHQPATYPMAHKAGFDLMLSGHTHGGQYFPFNIFIRFFQKYYKGLNKYNNMQIYINRGTGYWGPPLRTFVPAEITLITLRK